MDYIEILNYKIYLNKKELIEYLEEKKIKYKEKRNGIVFSVSNACSAIIFIKGNKVKYFKFVFEKLFYEGRKRLEEEFDEKYFLLETNITNTVRKYQEYNLVIRGAVDERTWIEGTIGKLDEEEEKLKKKLENDVKFTNGLKNIFEVFLVVIEFVFDVLS